MRLSFDTIAPIKDPLVPITCIATITNDTGMPATFWASANAHIYRGDIRVSPHAEFVDYDSYNPTAITLQPGDTWQATCRMDLNVFTYLGQTGRVTQPFTVRMTLPIPTEGEEHPGHYDGAGYHLEADLELRVDLTGFDWLYQPNGDVADFYRKDGIVYRRTEDQSPQAVETKNHADACALTHRILDDGTALFIFGHLKKRRPKGDLTGLNAVFYRTETTIFTEFGDAKVDDPATFEVLDNGMQGQMRGSVSANLGGYARDKATAYFFGTAGSSTTKATKLRACKSPESLVSLGCGFAKDNDHVYFEARKVAGADPATFTFINSHYWRDKKGIGFADQRTPEADPDTFEVIGETHKGQPTAPATFSMQGRDSNQRFNHGYIDRRDDDQARP